MHQIRLAPGWVRRLWSEDLPELHRLNERRIPFDMVLKWRPALGNCLCCWAVLCGVLRTLNVIDSSVHLAERLVVIMLWRRLRHAECVQRFRRLCVWSSAVPFDSRVPGRLFRRGLTRGCSYTARPSPLADFRQEPTALPAVVAM